MMSLSSSFFLPRPLVGVLNLKLSHFFLIVSYSRCANRIFFSSAWRRIIFDNSSQFISGIPFFVVCSIAFASFFLKYGRHVEVLWVLVRECLICKNPQRKLSSYCLLELFAQIIFGLFHTSREKNCSPYCPAIRQFVAHGVKIRKRFPHFVLLGGFEIEIGDLA